MAVKFSGSGTEYIKFTTPTNALGLTSKTIHLKYNHVGLEADGAVLWTIYDGTGTDSDEYNYVGIDAAGRILFFAHFSTTNGTWRTNSSLTVGQEYKIAITYNGSATSNDPIIYVNGVAQALTEIFAPAGTYRNGTSADMYISTPLTLSPNGNVEDVRIYNVIKTAAQAAAIANEDLDTDQNIDETGLVFHAHLKMCKGLTYDTYVGSTLATANEFIDRVNGYVGVPSGDPVGA